MSDTTGELVRIVHPELGGPWGPVTRGYFDFRLKNDGWTIAPEAIPTDPSTAEAPDVPDLIEPPKKTVAPKSKER